MTTGLVALCSPPAWGWSASGAITRGDRLVLPTRVGMVRSGMPSRYAAPCSPHPRGDGPNRQERIECLAEFSPPAWGWSAGVRERGGDERCSPHPRGDGPDAEREAATAAVVLPTRVGMVRSWCRMESASPCAPHPRGDGPGVCGRERDQPAVLPTRVGMVRRPASDSTEAAMFSPPAWGWSVESAPLDTANFSSPHPRGDGPSEHECCGYAHQCSPPAWGWSASRDTTPAPARRSPHPRGDGPAPTTARSPASWFSPPAWGWSAGGPAVCLTRCVLPTRVGMVRCGWRGR